MEVDASPSTVNTAISAAAKGEEAEVDDYTLLKLKQRKLTFLEIQEEFIKDEVGNLKREILRAAEEVTPSNGYLIVVYFLKL